MMRRNARSMYLKSLGVKTLNNISVSVNATISGFSKRIENGYPSFVVLTNVSISILPSVIIDHIWIEFTNEMKIKHRLNDIISFTAKIREYHPYKFGFHNLKLRKPYIPSNWQNQNSITIQK